MREWNGATLLVDVYNASPASMKAAIQVLGEGEVTGRRMAVIGEMKELGEATQEGHREVGRALLGAKVDWILLYLGAGTEETYDELRKGGQMDYTIDRAESIYDVHMFLYRKLKPGDVVLIKGSRALELESNT